MTDEPWYSFSKDKLPATFSYPLKRPLPDSALDAASVKSTVYSVRYLFRRKGAPATLDAWFSPHNGYHPSVSGRSLVTIWAVPSDQRKSCEDLLIAQGLPVLCRWLEQSSVAKNVWRSSAYSLSLIVRGGY